MTTEILKGIGIGISMLIGGWAIWMWKQKLIRDAKARAFDIEVKEKETKSKIDSMDPDSLIEEANKFMGKKD